MSQKTKAVIKANIDAAIIANGLGNITGPVLNGILNDMIDSVLITLEVKTKVRGEEHTGATASFLTLANAGIVGTLILLRNGVRLNSSQYSYPGGVTVTLTLTEARETTDVFIADYEY